MRADGDAPINEKEAVGRVARAANPARHDTVARVAGGQADA